MASVGRKKRDAVFVLLGGNAGTFGIEIGFQGSQISQ